MAGSATGNFAKLEGFCVGPFMCGDAPQSGDFHVWEMVDQHLQISEAVGCPSPLANCPKLLAMHAAMKEFPRVKVYLAHAFYKDFAHNNGLYTHFTGQPEDFVYDATTKETVTFDDLGDFV
eukprot:TRINITY_DN15948_c0_g1_i7.p1 TRINITY_DN15948_c0_g1~~TRINITY_DN15948_c0_g1_i7.p1  ORF type:complete len:121 (+),score=30.52 TRINITY_DN15948_c0_g1_i7:245-607(+)